MVSSKDLNQPCQLPSDNLPAKRNSKRAIGHTAKQGARKSRYSRESSSSCMLRLMPILQSTGNRLYI